MTSGPDPSAQRYKRPPRRNWKAAVRPHWTEIVLTAALVLVGIGQIVVYLQQAAIMDTQARISDEQTKNAFATERAYILMSHADTGMETPVVPNKVITVTAHNFGRTPADLRNAGGDCKYFTGEPPRLTLGEPISILLDQSGRLPPGVIIGPDKDAGDYHIVISATAEQISEAEKRVGKLVCRFRIDYDDVRGHPHQTHICLFWLAMPVHVGAFAAYPGECNYHD